MMNLSDPGRAPHGYEIFQKKQDGCVKAVVKPWQHLPATPGRAKAPHP